MNNISFFIPFSIHYYEPSKKSVILKASLITSSKKSENFKTSKLAQSKKSQKSKRSQKEFLESENQTGEKIESPTRKKSPNTKGDKIEIMSEIGELSILTIAKVLVKIFLMIKIQFRFQMNEPY